MDWVLAALALLTIGCACRRILRLDEPRLRPRGLTPLPSHLEKIYRPISQEAETQTILLGITLNEALEARHSGNEENALLHVSLALCQWDRLSEVITILLNSISHNLAQISSIASVRELTSSQFKSRTMIDFMKGGGLLHQIISRSKPRYTFRVHAIARAIQTLSAEFRSAHQSAERMPERSATMWNGIDSIFQDFDLTVKEALLAFRDFLPALPESALPEFLAEIARGLGQSSVRSKRATVSGRTGL